MLCTFCPLTILSDFYRIPENSPKSSADNMFRACELKDQTYKKTRTLQFSEELSPRFESQAFIGDQISPLKTQKLVLTDHAFVVLRFESRDWRSFV